MGTSHRRRFGAVRQLPSGRWQARYRDGRGRLRSAPETFPTKTAAGRWLALAEADMARGEWHDPRMGHVRLSDWADRWMDTTRHLRPSTRSLYGYLLNSHIQPVLGEVELGQITPLDVQAWLAGRHTVGLSPNTVAEAYRLLRSILNAAVDSGLIPRSPCTVKGAGTERHTEMRYATPEKVAELAEAAWPTLAGFGLDGGLFGTALGRAGRAPSAEPRSATQRVTVVEQVTEVNGVLSFGPTKSEAGRRTLSLPDIVLESLIEHMNSYSEPGQDGLVFPAPEGGPMRLPGEEAPALLGVLVGPAGGHRQQGPAGLDAPGQ